MKNRHLNIHRVCMISIALLVLLIGCSSRSTMSPKSTSTSVSSAPTAKSEPTAGMSSLATVAAPATKIEASPSPTIVPKVTLASKLPTPTMGPTIPIDQEETLVLELLQNNANCQLPCWWGFTPGKTSWQTAETYFASLGKKVDKFSNSRLTNYTVKFKVPSHDMQVGQVYNVKDELIDLIWVKGSTVRNGRRIFGDQMFLEDWNNYLLPQMLTTYGQPAEVLLKTFQSVPEGMPPFNLLLYYPQRGILVRYYGLAEKHGEQLRLCPQQSDITLWLWPSGHAMTLQEIANSGQDFPIEEVADYRPLGDVTKMSTEIFFESFKNANNMACIETPAKIWP